MPVSRWRPWLLLAAPLTVIGVLLLWPIVRVTILSFQQYGLREVIAGRPTFVGLDNFREVLTGDYLWSTVLPNTLIFAFVAVVGTIVLGTLVALLLQQLGTWGRVVVIGSALVAWALPAVTGTYIWVWIFEPDTGIARKVFEGLGLIGPEGFNWFTERWSFYSIAAINVIHHSYPFVAITIFAGLSTVPEELHEAAKLDGASAWRRFWSITVPIMRPVFAVVTILSTIWDFKVFAQIYLMPGGDGGNEEIFNLGVWSYITAMTKTDYGLGSAIAVLLTAVLLVITVLYIRALFREDDLQ
ncbi:N,N'-diacetylchitobiose transport system permease protein [Barrientosiimonas humi]|uniref:N,N'-diacetylchitobiose transport system permease protein n=2 Tax=Barrientosiimonas TaxID=1535207 RepID=A0A542XCQ0_9MICO|nr:MULTISPECIES: sugar ABC transporter permease [Barrientosiimonas]TQL33598.1 N,N'-diacetylchitobiose transport system permease protein [Barrientosiimonas humi]BDZ58520.1 sugar ABC transporter permease [Barrientosiimonas endolithica]CAG7573586.1 Inner membrane ABC transporter permease protein YcjO [Barrientosiimonas humi]